MIMQGKAHRNLRYILQKILTKLEESYHVFTTPTGFGAVFFSNFLASLDPEMKLLQQIQFIVQQEY